MLYSHNMWLYQQERDVGFRKIPNRFWKCLWHSIPFTHTVSPVWLDRIVFTASPKKIKLLHLATGDLHMWGIQVRFWCDRYCWSKKILLHLTQILYDFKVLYGRAPWCHIVTIEQMASHHPNPLSLRVLGSWFLVRGSWFLAPISSFLFPNSWLLISVLWSLVLGF